MKHRLKFEASSLATSLFAAGLAIGFVVVGCSQRYPETKTQPVTLVQSDQGIHHALEVSQSTSNLISVSSCASANCHGKPGGQSSLGGQPERDWKTSWSVWANEDPHADAYRTLENMESIAILKLLFLAEQGRQDDNFDEEARLRLISERCIKCHSTVIQDDFARHVLSRHGVNCQSCHGAAEKWVKAHYADNWKELSEDEKEKLEFFDLKSPVSLDQRARMCAGCHIGNGDQDMNHDLIAAGHPRLFFDFASYMQRMPKHWDGSEDPTTLWEVGQVESTRVAVKLLRHRAAEEEAGKPRTVWPEFAEYDCLNCHHELAGDWYRINDATNARLGRLTWSSWNVPHHVWSDPQSISESTPAPLELLRMEMHRRQPNAEKVVELCNRVVATLQPLSLNSTLKRQPQLDWDSVAHWYFAALARYETLKQRDADRSVDRKQLIDQLIELKSHLHIPFDDPTLSGENARRFDAKTVRSLIDSIREQLELETGK